MIILNLLIIVPVVFEEWIKRLDIISHEAQLRQHGHLEVHNIPERVNYLNGIL